MFSIRCFIFCMLCGLLFACGGGGSSSPGDANPPPGEVENPPPEEGENPPPEEGENPPPEEGENPPPEEGEVPPPEGSTGQKTGFFVDAAVAGIGYRTDSIGADTPVYTGTDGSFNYKEGEAITFHIGSLEFPPTLAKPTITPLDMAGANADIHHQTVINITRLLMSLDKDANPGNGITIDSPAFAAAYPVDFSLDAGAFENAVLNLVTNAGSGNAALVSEAEAKAHLQTSLEQSVNAYTMVSADGAETDNAFELFYEGFGGKAVEGQDCDGAHTAFGRHITEVMDEVLNKPVFEFHSHLHEDADCSTGKPDRQRIEVKTYDKSPDELISTEGEWHTYRWKFRLADGFQPSSGFTHIFQLKPVGGDDRNPIVSIIPRKKSPADKLEVRYNQSQDSGTALLIQEDLSLFNDKWIDAFVRIHSVDNAGYFEIVLRDQNTREVLLSYVNDNIDMFRTGALFNRPKWGIYRRIEEVASLRDETVRFNNFCIAEGTNTCPSDAGGDGDTQAQYDFEADVLGSEPGAPFTAVEGVISNEQARSGTRSVKLSDTASDNNGRLRLAPEQEAVSGTFKVSVWVPEEPGTDTYLTVYDGGFSAATNKVMEVILRANGDLRRRAADGSQISIGSYTQGQWNDFELSWTEVNTSNVFSLKMNSALIGTDFETALNGLTPDRIEVKYGISSTTAEKSIYVDDITAF